MKEALRYCAEHRDPSAVQRLLNSIPDVKPRSSLATHLKTQFPIVVKKSGAIGINKERFNDFDWSKLENAKIWPRRLHLSKETFLVGTERLTIRELIDDFIDAILLSRHVVPEGELQRLGETIDKVLHRRRNARPSATAPASVKGS